MAFDEDHSVANLPRKLCGSSRANDTDGGGRHVDEGDEMSESEPATDDEEARFKAVWSSRSTCQNSVCVHVCLPVFTVSCCLHCEEVPPAEDRHVVKEEAKHHSTAFRSALQYVIVWFDRALKTHTHSSVPGEDREED